MDNLQTLTAISSFPWGIRYTQQQPAEQILLLQQPRHQQKKQQRMNQTQRKTMCSQIITNSWHFIQGGFQYIFFSSNLQVNIIYRLICNTIFSDSDVLWYTFMIFFKFSNWCDFYFHFRKNIAIIAAVVSVTTILFIVAIVAVVWKSKSITHKCYLLFCVVKTVWMFS